MFIRLHYALLASLVCYGSLAVGNERPNILFISADDLNDVPTFMGTYEGAITPNMDRLAASGVAFLNAHVQYPICGPSRASIMSGILPTTLGYATHPNDNAVQERAQELGGDTIPNYFKQSGYKVMGVGKLFHKHLPEGTFTESGTRGGGFGGFGGSYSKHKRNYPYPGTGTDWGVTDTPDKPMPDEKNADWLIQRLQQQHDAPFLLMLGLLRPHVPWIVRQEYFDRYPEPEKIQMMPYKADDLDDVPEISRKLNIHSAMPQTDWLIRTGKWNFMMHSYLASTTFIDDQIGRVLDALEASPYANNTIVVFWSDHGYHLGEKGTTQKHSLWQRSSRVPFIIAGPGIKPALSKRAVGLIDLFPTLVELCGIEPLDAWEGRSLVPLLEDPDKPWDHPVITSWAGSNYAVQTERYRYIRYTDGSEELYDHEKDPHEWKNLSALSEYDSLKQTLSKGIPTVDNSSPTHVKSMIGNINRYRDRVLE